jgi:hypothetical protein
MIWNEHSSIRIERLLTLYPTLSFRVFYLESQFRKCVLNPLSQSGFFKLSIKVRETDASQSSILHIQDWNIDFLIIAASVSARISIITKHPFHLVVDWNNEAPALAVAN